MALRCGIVGLPNVGKSTLFNALTNANIAAENFPFCTIEPNIGVVKINDPRLEHIAKIVNPQAILHAHVEFVDIAGLVKGASKGEGKGNQFLSNIKDTSALIHVVRCFEDEGVIHVDGKVSPDDDIAIINTELLLSDLEVVERNLKKNHKIAQAGDNKAKSLMIVLEKAQMLLNEGEPIRSFNWGEEELALLSSYQLITQKPVLYVANTSENPTENLEHIEKVRTLAQKEKGGFLSICNRYEAELVDLSSEEKKAFLKEIGEERTGLDRLIGEAFSLLGLQNYFTAGVKEVRAWTIKKGDKAPRAAAAIHTDFERGFIRAEVIAYEDFLKEGGEAGAKTKGKMRVEGKDYLVQDGDIMHFRFNV